MPPTPTTLRDAAAALRRSAAFITLAWEPVGPRGDATTWQGPAATAFRTELRAITGQVAGAAAALRAGAARLEVRADQLQAEIDAARREAERRRAEREEVRRWWAEELRCAEERDRPGWRGPCPSPGAAFDWTPAPLPVDLGLLARRPPTGER